MDDPTRPQEIQEPTGDSANSGYACLVMVYGEYPGRRYLIEEESLLAGRAPDCDIHLADASVSRHHCRFEPEPEGVSIVDLESTNITLVNGTPIARQRLADGDRIAIGRSLFKFLHNDNIETSYHAVIVRVMTTDPLTGAFNRSHFKKEIGHGLYRLKRYKRPITLVFMDLDRFQNINDRFGELAGDRVLTQLGNLVFGALRAGDVFCRWGGEKFAVLLPETTMTGAIAIAERLRQRVESTHFSFEEQAISVTLSMGLAEANGENVSAEAWIAEADRRLDEAKAAGRNCVRPVRDDT
ncbi:MAG: GGDEF domain-containing protein [Candidatus Lernaella stagnicola]|nr:GGDEF domain-containing protein [Candidatus Lernaella stagnicola]